MVGTPHKPLRFESLAPTIRTAGFVVLSESASPTMMILPSIIVHDVACYKINGNWYLCDDYWILETEIAK